MKKTFREKVVFYFTNVIRKHKILKYPCLGCMAVILGIYYIGMHFATNGKRYGSIAFVCLFFMTSCSFSFAVFAQQTGFIKAQETYSAIVADSDATLAENMTAGSDEQIIREADTGTKYNVETNSDVRDTYTLDDILANEDNYIAASESTEESAEEDYVFDPSDWRLVLVNKQHPIPDDYTFNLKIITGYWKADERIIADLLAMMQAAKDDGIDLAICSPYRSDGHQEELFEKKMKHYMGQGLSYMDSYKVSSQTVMVPGSSEHQIGLAIDFNCATYTDLDAGFADTEAGKWLAAHCSEYGFVIRYPLGKEYITSVEYEPWHFRYVGKAAAGIMTKEGICLEEFWDKYLYL